MINFPRIFFPVELLFIYSLAYSAPSHGFMRHVEWSIEAGPSWLHGSHSGLQVTEIEHDTFHTQQNAIATSEAAIGVSSEVYHKSETSHHVNWWPSFNVGLNVRHTNTGSITGQVWQFDQADLNNYAYNAPFSNTRLMIEGRAEIVSMQKTAWFIVAGVGPGRSTLEYYDKSLLPEWGGSLSLYSYSQLRLVSEVGTGLSYGWNEQWKFSIKYLYTNFGRLQTSGQGVLNFARVNLEPLRFSICSQAMMLSMHFST